jgi:hypothetical protein
MIREIIKTMDLTDVVQGSLFFGGLFMFLFAFAVMTP